MPSEAAGVARGWLYAVTELGSASGRWHSQRQSFQLCSGDPDVFAFSPVFLGSVSLSLCHLLGHSACRTLLCLPHYSAIRSARPLGSLCHILLLTPLSCISFVFSSVPWESPPLCVLFP